MIYGTKKTNKKEGLQNYVSKNTMKILFGLLIALVTVGCPASNSGGPAAPTFPYVCPDGTPTAGMVATEDTVSCSSCNTAMGYQIFDSRCIRFDGNFSQIGTADQFGVSENFPRGLASIGDALYMVGGATDASYTLDTSTGVATRVGVATNFNVSEDLPRGLASIGNKLYMVGDSADVLYTLDITPGSSTLGEATRVGMATNFGVVVVDPAKISPRGLASITDGGTTTLYMVDDETNALYTLDTSSGEATRVGMATNFGVTAETGPRGLASIGDALYMVGGATDALYKAVTE